MPPPILPFLSILPILPFLSFSLLWTRLHLCNKQLSSVALVYNPKYVCSRRWYLHNVSVKEDESLSLNSYGEINPLYRGKKDKVKPVNRPHQEGLKPKGVGKWKEQIAVYKSDDSNKSGSQYPWLIPKFSNIERGWRLTPERIEKLKLGESLTSEERIVPLEVLFNREAGIAFDFTEKGYFKPEVEPPHAIPTIQHDQWEVSNFRVPKALEKNVTEIIKANLDYGVLERSFGPYRNPWFLFLKRQGNIG